MKKKWIAVITAVCMISLFGCLHYLREMQEEKYTVITSVNGVEFDVPKNYLTQATAITGISDDEDYGTYTYVYSDGKSTYLLFDMDQIIMIVDNQTDYGLQNSTNIGETITEKPIDGVWFNLEDKADQYDMKIKNDAYRLIHTVRSDVSVTENQGGTFVGKFANVSVSGVECSMFVGARGECYSELDFDTKRMLEHIAKSLNITDHTALSNVDINTDLPVSGRKGKLDIADNQGEIGNKYSDIYHLLAVGMTGTYLAYDKNSEFSLSSGEITVEQLYTGEDAIDIIKAYCNSGKSMRKYMEAPEGFSWHVIKYSLSQSQKDLYTNIKIEGLDGNRLVYQGVSCTSRTYDIIYDWNKKNDLYCYYAVPNGCKEYMLECGNRYKSTSETACYRINIVNSE